MSYCNRCGVEVKWLKRKRGWVPYDLPASESIHRCGKPKGPVTALVGKTGQPVPPCANPCGLPPWERCACSFPELVSG